MFRMKRRKFITLLGGVVAAAWSLAAHAQQANVVPRLGWLGNLTPTAPFYDGLRKGLRGLGYVEGKNITIEARWAEGNFDRLPELARELARLNVNVMLVAGDQGLRAAKQATTTIPIVVTACDPLDSLVASIARPGGKATGVTCVSSELAGKRLQLLKEVVPGVVRIAVLYNPGDHNKAPEYRQIQQVAGSLNLSSRAFEARSPAEIDAAFVAIVEDHAQALLTLADPLMNFHVKRLADLALKSRLPAIYGFREFPDAGGLISYGANNAWTYWRAASYIDKIFKGANPGDLPIEQPTKFELIINLKTAKALGIAIPNMLLAIADEVIE